MRKINILAIADLHWYTDIELAEIENIDFDVCVLLGDIPVNAIRLIVEHIFQEKFDISSKTVVLPEVVQNDYNGKTYFQWKTKKG